MLVSFNNESVVNDFIKEVRYGTYDDAKKYLSKSVKSIDYITLKKILSNELNINYLKSYYFSKNNNIHSVLIINMNKQNDILHFYLKKEKNYISNLKIYKIEKE